MAQSLKARDHAAVWHPYTQAHTDPAPVAIVRGLGASLFDESGREYIDATSSWWVNLHGHAHPHIAARVAEQLAQLHHVIFAGATHAPAVDLAERLLAIVPGGHARVFYSDNGSTAVEAAIKMALQFWHNQSLGGGGGRGGGVGGRPRTRLLALENGYHGDTVGSMSLAGRGLFNGPFEPLLFEVISLPAPDGSGAALRAARQALASEPFAAMVYEPLLQAAGGMCMYDRDEMNDVLTLVRASGALLIADEVMTGFGRTGPLFASGEFDCLPDCLCLSKGITGGSLPMGVTTTTSRVFDAFVHADRRRAFLHGHSYTGNPLACAAALASLDLLLTPECVAQRARIEAQHRAFASIIASHASVSSVRILGTVLALTVRTSDDAGYFSGLRNRLMPFYLEQGVLLRPLGNVIYTVPPYCITGPELDRVHAVIRRSLELVP